MDWGEWISGSPSAIKYLGRPSKVQWLFPYFHFLFRIIIERLCVLRNINFKMTRIFLNGVEDLYLEYFPLRLYNFFRWPFILLHYRTVRIESAQTIRSNLLMYLDCNFYLLWKTNKNIHIKIVFGFYLIIISSSSVHAHRSCFRRCWTNASPHSATNLNSSAIYPLAKHRSLI